MNETRAIAAYVSSIEYDDVPESVREHAKTAIRDYVGVALYGATHDVGESIFAYVDEQYADGASTVFRHGSKSRAAAALANGAFGHAIDYDDTFESIVIHPTSPVFAAALATAENVGASTRALVTGYVVGCEVAYRVGQSTYPDHYEKGWHSTGTAGSFGAAAAAASVADLADEQVANAFGVVASSSSALKKNFGTMTKPLHAGHAAEMGVRATLLARNGFTADPTIFEGEIGYPRVMTIDDAYDPDAITDGLHDDWNVLDIGFKPYPSGIITHAAMDAMKELTREHDLGPETVDSVVVTLDDAASEMLHHRSPDDALQAKFSIEFCLAAILREGDAGVHEFTDNYVQQPETREMIAIVDRAFESNLFGDSYAGYGAIVRVTTTDGTEHRKEVRHAPGSPNNPIGDDRLREKFLECATSTISRADATALDEIIRTIETRRMADFVQYIR